ncbi:hypothetical protein SAMN05421547_1681 [Delftia lacustris]|uniref:FRG domain-containing protein n=2 Tax=Delftia lacustris TaxID=558537 RepID=A0A1H3UNM3_9BURK|nr:hypothetical protein SAMN05421547_1681 [Delftia lacustris]
MRSWCDPFSGNTWESVSDRMYGNKQFSSSFKTEDFIKYITGQHKFPSLPPFISYEARSIEDIHEILADTRRASYISDGSLTYRGQPKEYHLKRKIPNPVRADSKGLEISVLAGAYRQANEFYSFALQPKEQRSFQDILGELEPNQPDLGFASISAYDIMRTEQHYATQTSGLDLAFELDTAIFFATHQFRWRASGKAYYERVKHGEHSGIIYCFRFRDPPVKRSQYYIKEFDLFKTYPPTRIIRQDCGLPLIGEYERNIAITDIDCIIRLHHEFEMPKTFKKSPEYMFPSIREDKFYEKLLTLKQQHQDLLTDVVEYEWART